MHTRKGFLAALAGIPILGLAFAPRKRLKRSELRIDSDDAIMLTHEESPLYWSVFVGDNTEPLFRLYPDGSHEAIGTNPTVYPLAESLRSGIIRYRA